MVRGRKLRKWILDDLCFPYKTREKYILGVSKHLILGFKGITKFWNRYSRNEKGI